MAGRLRRHRRGPRRPRRGGLRGRQSGTATFSSSLSAPGFASTPEPGPASYAEGGRPSRCQTTRCGNGISMPSWSNRALIRCRSSRATPPLLHRRGLDQHPQRDRVRGERLDAGDLGLLDDHAVEVVVLPQVVGDLVRAPARRGRGPRRSRRRRRRTARDQFWLMLPTRRISPLRTYQTVPLSVAQPGDPQAHRLDGAGQASPRSTTSPTPYWSSKIMKMPERKSLTSVWAPKPSATPMMPALAMIGRDVRRRARRATIVTDRPRSARR